MEKKQNKLDTIVEEEEEETRTFQKETIPAADISERNPKDKIDKSDLSDVPDDEDNAVVIVDLVDIVRKKETGCADKKEGSCDSRLAGESSRHKLERRQFRDKEDCPHGMSEEELKTPEKNRIDKDKKETPFSTNKGNVSGCSSGDESQPETFRPISETRFEHPTGSVVADIEDVVENLAPNQSWASLFNWDDFGYSLILGFAPTAWDVYSDLTIADELAQKERDTISAGLSYLFICFPGLYMFNEALTEKLSSYSSVIAVVVNFCWTILRKKTTDDHCSLFSHVLCLLEESPPVQISSNPDWHIGGHHKRACHLRPHARDEKDRGENDDGRVQNGSSPPASPASPPVDQWSTTLHLPPSNSQLPSHHWQGQCRNVPL